MSNLMELQASVKLRAEDLREELADLVKWEAEIKSKDAALKHKVVVEPDFPAVRGSPKPAAPAKPKQDPIAVAKEQGNEYFKLKQYDDAIRMYTKAIDRDPHSANQYVLFGNRAMCYIKQGQWLNAEKDATTCIQMNRTFPKGFFRRAVARRQLGKLEEARSDLETLLVLQPHDPDGERELVEISTLLQQQKKPLPRERKKKLVIEEVDDEEEESARGEELERLEVQRKIAADAAAAKKAHELQLRKQAEVEEARLKSQRKINPRVEELEEDSPKKDMKTTEKKNPLAGRVYQSKCVYTVDTMPIPKSFSEFERIFSEVQSDTTLKVLLFSSIPGSSWRTVFGNSMTPEFLLEAFAAAGSSGATQAATILQGVATVERLDEIILFFDESDRSTIQRALENAKAVLSSGEVDSLRKKFL